MTDEELQDFNDSMLNPEHPLYYENNPEEATKRSESSTRHQPYYGNNPEGNEVQPEPLTKSDCTSGCIGFIIIAAMIAYLLLK